MLLVLLQDKVEPYHLLFPLLPICLHLRRRDTLLLLLQQLAFWSTSARGRELSLSRPSLQTGCRGWGERALHALVQL